MNKLKILKKLYIIEIFKTFNKPYIYGICKGLVSEGGYYILSTLITS